MAYLVLLLPAPAATAGQSTVFLYVYTTDPGVL